MLFFFVPTGVEAHTRDDHGPEARFRLHDARLPAAAIPPRPAPTQPFRPFLLNQAYLRARQERLRQQTGIEDEEDEEPACLCSLPPPRPKGQ